MENKYRLIENLILAGVLIFLAVALAACAPSERVRDCTVATKAAGIVDTYECGTLETDDRELFNKLTAETTYEMFITDTDHIAEANKEASNHDR